MNKEVWEARKSKRGIAPQSAPDENSKHVGSVSGSKLFTPRKSHKTGKPKTGSLPSNHERVLAARALKATGGFEF